MTRRKNVYLCVLLVDACMRLPRGHSFCVLCVLPFCISIVLGKRRRKSMPLELHKSTSKSSPATKEKANGAFHHLNGPADVQRYAQHRLSQSVSDEVIPRPLPSYRQSLEGLPATSASSTPRASTPPTSPTPSKSSSKSATSTPRGGTQISSALFGKRSPRTSSEGEPMAKRPYSLSHLPSHTHAGLGHRPYYPRILVKDEPKSAFKRIRTEHYVRAVPASAPAMEDVGTSRTFMPSVTLPVIAPSSVPIASPSVEGAQRISNNVRPPPLPEAATSPTASIPSASVSSNSAPGVSPTSQSSPDVRQKSQYLYGTPEARPLIHRPKAIVAAAYITDLPTQPLEVVHAPGGGTQYRCIKCKSLFSDSKAITAHVCQAKQKQLQCEVCGKRFTKRGNLASHELLHAAESNKELLQAKPDTGAVKPFGCDICNRRFAHQNTLTKHRRTHTDERPYPCDKCDKTFRQRSTLKEHLRVHTGERPYKCDFCDKAFSQSSMLTTHRRIHTGEKPMICEICGRGFSDHSHFSKHRRSHTGEKPNQCGVCGKSFVASCELTRHSRVHSGEKPYKCEVCGQQFGDKSHCRRHHRKRHPGTEDAEGNKDGSKSPSSCNTDIEEDMEEENDEQETGETVELEATLKAEQTEN